MRARATDAKAENYLVGPVLKALRVLDLVAAMPDGLSLAAAAERLRLPKTSAYRYLVTLRAAGYLDHDPHEDVYRIGSKLSSHARADDSFRKLRALAVPLMTRIVERFNETVNLAVFSQGRIVYVEMMESRRSLRTQARIGDRGYLHSTALGKAVLAFLPPERRAAILSVRLPALTPRTVTEPSVLIRQLDEIARRGYATEVGENEEGSVCIAVPICSFARLPVAALSVSAPEPRVTPYVADAIATMLLETGAVLSAAIGFQSTGINMPVAGNPTRVSRGQAGSVKRTKGD